MENLTIIEIIFGCELLQDFVLHFVIDRSSIYSTCKVQCVPPKSLPALRVYSQTRLSSDSEAATMYKLKGQSLNMRTGQGFKYRELVRPAGPSSWSVQLVRPAGLSG